MTDTTDPAAPILPPLPLPAGVRSVSVCWNHLGHDAAGGQDACRGRVKGGERPERVNDFAAPFAINLLRKCRAFCR